LEKIRHTISTGFQTATETGDHFRFRFDRKPIRVEILSLS